VITVFSEGTVDLSAANLSVLALLTLVALLVLMVTAALGVAISALVRRSLVALSVSTSIWVIAILILPSLVPYIASSFKEVSTFEAAQRDIALKETKLIQEELSEQRKTAADLKSQQIGVESAWQRYLKLRRRWMEIRNEEIGRMARERKKVIHDQQDFARRISLFSPYMALKEVLGSLCDTGLTSYDEFLVAVERYRQQEFLPESFDLLSRQKPWLNPANPDDRLQLRPLQAPSPTLSGRLAAAAWPLSILIAEIIILIIWGALSFERYDVR